MGQHAMLADVRIKKIKPKHTIYMQSQVKVIPVIYQTLETRGTGKDNTSPVRTLTRVHDLKGNLIAESDPNSYTIEQIAKAFTEVTGNFFDDMYKELNK